MLLTFYVKKTMAIPNNIIIYKIQDSFKLILDPITIDYHHGSIDMLYVTGDLDRLVILLGKDFFHLNGALNSSYTQTYG